MLSSQRLLYLPQRCVLMTKFCLALISNLTQWHITLVEVCMVADVIQEYRGTPVHVLDKYDSYAR